MIGLGGTDANGHEVWYIPPMPVETRAFSGLISKEVLEAQQFSNFLQYAQLSGATSALQRYELGGDPPDLIVTPLGGSPLGVELTSLSVTDVSRQRLDDIRRLARDVTQRLTEDPTRYSHLHGRTASIAEHQSDSDRPRKRKARERQQLINALAECLQDDFGVSGRHYADPDNPPKTIPAHIAQRGSRSVDEYEITVRSAEQAPGQPLQVTADIQISIHEVDLRERLIDRIKAKDRQANDILLISTGLTDKDGFVQGADHYIFQQIKQLATKGLSIEPKYLNQVIVHQWRTSDAMVLYQRPNAPLLIQAGCPD